MANLTFTSNENLSDSGVSVWSAGVVLGDCLFRSISEHGKFSEKANSISACSHKQKLDQSSLRSERPLRNESPEISRDEMSISDHGISRIAKGIDLHFIKKPGQSVFQQSERLDFKGLAEQYYMVVMSRFLPKKLYIQPKILHFYNI